jgi:hypothetical protein
MKTIKIAGVPEHFNLPWHLCIDDGEFVTDLGIDIPVNNFQIGVDVIAAARPR